MVKGNWERRAELVAARRLEERSKKANKAAGAKLFATGESVVTKLSRDPGLSDASIDGWLETDTSVPVCQNWLRSEQCQHKKCRLIHDSNIAHLADVRLPDAAGQAETRTEPLCSGPINIKDIAKRDCNKLRFIAVNGVCVYDHLFPDVWTTWSEERAILATKLDTSKMNTIEENSICLMLNGIDTKLSDNEQEDPPYGDISVPDFCAFFHKPDHQAVVPFNTIISNIILFLDPVSTAGIAMSSKQIYHQCLKNEMFRLRRREGVAAFVAGHSKIKKQEKKKKAKQANVKKDSKKDAFARGGNSH